MARFNLRPRRKPSPFPFLALPTELRLQIYNYLLLSVPSYSYTHTDWPRPRSRRRRYPLREHGMLLANRQLHAEYMQAFYEHTSFSFYLDTKNGTQMATVPFLTVPPALLCNLRQCKLRVNLGVLMRGLDFLREALVVRIEALLGGMERMRWVHLVWDLSIMIGMPPRDEELWERLGERFVQRLKWRAGMQGITVTVGKRILELEKKGAEWVERYPFGIIGLCAEY